MPKDTTDVRIEDNHPCPQCGAQPGERHRGFDDLARCRFTGIQCIQCLGENDLVDLISDGENPEDYDTPLHAGYCEVDIWDGEYPGVKACREFGWYTDRHSVWGVALDLNRLYSGKEAHWDVNTERYVLNNPVDISGIIM